MSGHTKVAWNGEQWKVQHEPAGHTDVVFEIQDSELHYLVAELFGAPADRLRHARLIASAPALLALVERCLPFVKMRANRFDGDSVIDRVQDLAAVLEHDIRQVLAAVREGEK